MNLWFSPNCLGVDVDKFGIDESDDYGYGWYEHSKRFEALKSGPTAVRGNRIVAYC